MLYPETAIEIAPLLLSIRVEAPDGIQYWTCYRADNHRQLERLLRRYRDGLERGWRLREVLLSHTVLMLPVELA